VNRARHSLLHAGYLPGLIPFFPIDVKVPRALFIMTISAFIVHRSCGHITGIKGGYFQISGVLYHTVNCDFRAYIHISEESTRRRPVIRAVHIYVQAAKGKHRKH
jgi:hypothetical protein